MSIGLQEIFKTDITDNSRFRIKLNENFQFVESCLLSGGSSSTFSGGTVEGTSFFTNGLSGTSMSAGTIFLSGSPIETLF